MDYHDYYGLGVIVITIPPQKELSTVDDEAWWRDGDETVKAKGASKIAELTRRFS